ncbi:hypothetical protein [Rhodomicrobium vannielii]|uniref:hypothetical protein n=1 Tax=Rhodomicrobium vannielii TaxID=1069 RepID=UPI0001C248E0|nr:hypothetical protein [Rhodomicrobium vannielii]
MNAPRLLLPHELRTRRVVTETARAFRFGPRLHPNRAAYEFYPTPPEATRALLSVERFDGPIWEPACGTGWISEELIAAGYDVLSTDLVNYGYGRMANVPSTSRVCPFPGSKSGYRSTQTS